MNATSTFTDRELIDAEWGPARHDLARSAANETTLAQRDAALGWSEDN
ncbi:MAG TPA: hypothetical protein VN108_00330 [Marmoricola sp.]|nr:hypothetical protein [Marmoricola sp.]